MKRLDLRVDLTSPKHKTNPYPLYSHLRDELPVCRVPRQRAWLVTRYSDVLQVLKDPRLVKDRRNAENLDGSAGEPWVPKLFKPLTRNMLDLDDPHHARLRNLVHKAFSPRLVEGLRQRVQTLTDVLLDAAWARRHMDLIRDYALPIPTIVIAEMLGIPAADRHKFHRWSRTVVSTTPSPWGMVRAMPAVIAFLRYIRRLIERQRAAPEDDLLGALVQAEEAGDSLSSDELVAMVFLLLVAGHETTVNLIGNGALALLTHPEQREHLSGDPELITSAIEELLRFDSPLELTTERYASEDLSIAGVLIPRGALVYGAIASANRDPRQFPRPDELDLAREPNRHLAFGQGGHYCLGAPLARLEGQIAIATLLRRLPTLRLAVPAEALRWRKSLVLRGLRELPASW